MKQSGFTLIELLVVLSILSILIMVSAPLQFSTINNQQEEQFIEQLHHDVLLVQNQNGYTERDRMLIRFNDEYYEVIRGSSGLYAKRSYPPGWRLITGNHRELRYLDTGTVIQPRTLIMFSPTERIAFVFPLGKGRFYVEKEKRIFND